MTHEIEQTPHSLLASALVHGTETMSPSEVASNQTELSFFAFGALLAGASPENAVNIAARLHTTNHDQQNSSSGGIEGSTIPQPQSSRLPRISDGWKDQ